MALCKNNLKWGSPVDIGQILTLTANKFPNRTAIIFENNRFTYQEFNWRANQFAHSLLQLGLKKGEKVAVLLFNSNHFVEVYFGTAKVGGIFTPINFRFAPDEGVISCRISVCYFPLPLVPSRRGRGKFTFYETIICRLYIKLWPIFKLSSVQKGLFRLFNLSKYIDPG